MNRSSYPRRYDLDALRATAMLLGIVLHAGLSFTPFPWAVQDERQSSFFWFLFATIHGFRLPVFFGKVLLGFARSHWPSITDLPISRPLHLAGPIAERPSRPPDELASTILVDIFR